MNDDERTMLLQTYMAMPEEDLREMLMQPEADYREGIFALGIEAARSRGLYANRDEIAEEVMKSTTAKREIAQRFAERPLSDYQRILFTILPGIAFWYVILTPQGWVERKKEAEICLSIGGLCYCSIALTLMLAMLLFSNKPESSDELLKGVVFMCLLIGANSVVLFFQKRKQRERNQQTFGDRLSEEAGTSTTLPDNAAQAEEAKGRDFLTCPYCGYVNSDSSVTRCLFCGQDRS